MSKKILILDNNKKILSLSFLLFDHEALTKCGQTNSRVLPGNGRKRTFGEFP